MKEIKYISEEDFTKLTKKQKLDLEPNYTGMVGVEINRLVIIPTQKKSGDYCIGHFFAYTSGKGWWKSEPYDCFRIVTDYDYPAKPKYGIIKGDFENHGVQIFSFFDENHKAYLSYGGEVTIRKIK